MPAPKWFQKLRRRKKGNQQQQAAVVACRSPQAAAAAAAAANAAAAPARVDDRPSSRRSSSPPSLPAVSPNRASYYFASADRARQDRELPCTSDVALDVRVDVVHRRAGERRRRQRLGGLDAPPGTPELKLRRIVTRHAGADASDSCGGGFSSASATTSAATTPSTRARGFHVKPPGSRRHHRRRRRHDHDGGANKKGKAAMVELEDMEEEASPLHRRQHGDARRRRRWLYESVVVVKASSDPEREMAESMAEMVVANGIRSSEDLEELLACYLALNAAEHHRAVVSAFRHVWSLLARHSLLL
ncbi:unnamed protein product [Urochloa humidicola]